MVGPATRNLWGDGRFAMPHSGAASQLAVGFGWSVPLRGTYGGDGRWLCHVGDALCHVEMRYGMREMRSVLEGHVYMKPTASCGAAQLWAYA